MNYCTSIHWVMRSLTIYLVNVINLTLLRLMCYEYIWQCSLTHKDRYSRATTIWIPLVRLDYIYYPSVPRMVSLGNQFIFQCVSSLQRMFLSSPLVYSVNSSCSSDQNSNVITIFFSKLKINMKIAFLWIFSGASVAQLNEVTATVDYFSCVYLQFSFISFCCKWNILMFYRRSVRPNNKTTSEILNMSHLDICKFIYLCLAKFVL